MPLLHQIKIMFKKVLTLVNHLPRLHFWLVISLFVFLLIISLIPASNPNGKTIKRELTLPTSESLKDDYAVAEPSTVNRDANDKLLPDFSANREIDITISAGDTLSEIFSEQALSAAVLQELLEADREHLRLANLLPGQEVQLLVSPSNQLLSLKVIIDRANTLSFVLKDDIYVSDLEVKEGEWRNSYYQGSVTGSFYVSAKKTGLSASQIQQISGALQEQFDFNRQLRVGDTFHVLVAKQYIEGAYSFDSEVLAVILKTRSRNYTAFLNEDGRYYDKNGKGLSKAYRRYPVNGRPRISSRFNPRRLHPVTKRVRPHNGTDFAVGVGTNVYAVGDGVVLRAGYHPAAGNYIVIKHGRKYTTRFLHLSKILVRKGQRIEMGKLIGKSGNTGRSTGPHLHYEFHVYNKPVDAMKVDLPLSQEVPQKDKKAFNERRDLSLREMGEL
ncbi:peptidoglycan DD-metalloendopeptidase family protein [Psychromonas arctica]|uniref:peptidoglycan DD-metalloendopeptidase family protein n=1 Tax=Psychromonas arctica TaxID=168275 RepID=UPI00040E9792|nr:peptidoglycan DD-metalloendopeptidase family protein [Psychromonas arctica]